MKDKDKYNLTSTHRKHQANEKSKTKPMKLNSSNIRSSKIPPFTSEQLKINQIPDNSFPKLSTDDANLDKVFWIQ